MEDDIGEEAQLPPPPAYSEAVKSKPTSGPRPTPPRTTIERKPPSTSTIDYSAVDIETRSKLRRENLARLKKEAEYRVARRAEEDARRRKSRQDSEDMEIDRLREEKRLQIEKSKQENMLEKEKLNVLMKKLESAGKFYNKQLLVRVGMAPWIRLIEQRRMSSVRAKSYYDDHLVQSTFMALYSYAMLEKNERSRKEYKQTLLAATYYRKKLLKNIWKHWYSLITLYIHILTHSLTYSLTYSLTHSLTRSLTPSLINRLLHRKMLRTKAKAVTGHFSRFCLRKNAFRAWRIALERLRRSEVSKLRAVIPRGNNCIKRHFWLKWLEYLSERRVERQIDFKANMTWAKVQGWMKEGI